MGQSLGTVQNPLIWHPWKTLLTMDGGQWACRCQGLRRGTLPGDGDQTEAAWSLDILPTLGSIRFDDKVDDVIVTEPSQKWPMADQKDNVTPRKNVSVKGMELTKVVGKLMNQLTKTFSLSGGSYHFLLTG